MGLSNAERQERWRVKRAAEIEALRKAAANAKGEPSQELAEARKEIERLRRELAAATKAAPASPHEQAMLRGENALLRQQVKVLKAELAAGPKPPKPLKTPLPPDEVRERQIKALRTEIRNLKAARYHMNEVHIKQLGMAGVLDRKARAKIMFVLHPDQRNNATDEDRDEACKLFTPLVDADKAKARRER